MARRDARRGAARGGRGRGTRRGPGAAAPAANAARRSTRAGIGHRSAQRAAAAARRAADRGAPRPSWHDPGGSASGARRLHRARLGGGAALLVGDHRQRRRAGRRAAPCRAALARRAAERQPRPRLRSGATEGWRRGRALCAAAPASDDAVRRAAPPIARRARHRASRRWRKRSASRRPISRRSSMAGAAGPPMRWSSRICAQLNIIWDDADELIAWRASRIPASRSTPPGFSPAATELANLLAERIRKLPPERVARLLDLLKSTPAAAPKRRRR